MSILKVVLHNEINYPIYFDFPVPPELLNAIRSSRIKRAKFLVHSVEKDGKIIEPVLPSISPDNNFKVLTVNKQLYLKIMLYNAIKHPITIDVPVPPELIAAIRTSRITRSEFLIVDSGKELTVLPKLVGQTELNSFKIL